MINIKEDLSNLKVGDKVYSLLYGWDEVVKITVANIIVGHSTLEYYYDKKGSYIQNQNQTLFTYNPFEKVSEFPKWMEMNDSGSKTRMYVVHKTQFGTYLAFPDPNRMELFYGGYYDEWKEPETTELTIKEIEEKLGISNLKIVK